MQYIGERKLSWLEVFQVIGYVLRRIAATRLRRGSRYSFGEQHPVTTIHAAVATTVEHSLKMPIERAMPFQIDAVREAIHTLTSYRSKDRIVIDIAMSTTD